ncbi:MAG: tRNA dihydrouridine synthase DusB, partial [Sphingomonadaceae bacterium]|nr:tRNA dihydrouridine synthase DusB [Sphingomonadaceae bacterium]
GQQLADPALDEQLAVILEHYQAMLDHYGTDTGVKMARKHLGWYTRGLRDSAQFRNMINFVDDAEEVMRRLREFYDPFLQKAAA